MAEKVLDPRIATELSDLTKELEGLPLDPESNFLLQTTINVYPNLRARYPDLSLAEIRRYAETFRGARVRSYIGILLTRAVIEGQKITPGPTIFPVLETPILQADPLVPPPTRSHSFLRRLQKPFQRLGIKF